MPMPTMKTKEALISFMIAYAVCLSVAQTRHSTDKLGLIAYLYP
jgi:hypothetical protein